MQLSESGRISRRRLKPSYPSLGPSIVWLEEPVRRIQRDLSRFNIVFICGRPVCGKSTLLQQVALEIAPMNRAHLSVSFSAEIDFPFAVKQIAEALQISVTFEGPDILRQMDRVLEDVVIACNERSLVLFLDNIDRVRNPKRLIDFFVKNLKSGAVVASCLTLPEMDPSLAADISIYRFNGLSFAESCELIRKSNLQVRENQAQAVFEKIYKLTLGNPFKIKLLIAPAILESRNLLLEDVDENEKLMNDHYFEKILKSLGSEISDILCLAAFVHYDRYLENTILRRLSIQQLRFLGEIGCISSGQPFLMNGLRGYILRTFQKDDEIFFRRLILNLVSDARYESKKEKLWQLMCLKEDASAIMVLDELALQMTQSGDLTDLISLSDSYVGKLSTDAVLLRRKALAYLKRPEQALEELKSELQKPLSNDHRFQIYFFIAKTHYSLAHFDKSVEFIDKILQECEPSERIYVHSLIEKAYMVHYKTPDVCRSLLCKAEPLLSQFYSTDNLLWGDFHFSFGMYYYYGGQITDASVHFRAAIKFFKQGGLKPAELMATFDAVSMEYNTGNAVSALKELETVEREGRRFSLDYLIDYCVDMRCIHSINQGHIQAAINILKPVISDLKIITDRGVVSLNHLFVAYLDAGRLVEAQDVLENLCSSEFIRADKQRNVLYSVMREVIRQFILKNTPRDISRVLNSASHLNQRNKARLNLWLLELNFSHFFPMNLGFVLDTFDLEKNGADLPVLVQYDCLLGFHFIYDGQIKRAQEKFSSSLQLAKSFDYHIWEARSRYGLAIVDLMTNNPKLALAQAVQAIESLSKIDKREELNFAIILKALAYLKLGEVESFRSTIGSISSSNICSYFAAIFSKYLSEQKIYCDIGLNLHEKKFFDYLISHLGFDRTQKIKIKTHTHEEVIYESRQPAFSSKDFDILIDEINTECRIGRAFIPFSAKPTLVSILQFLLINHGQFVSKEDLAAFIWHEEYNPLVHDARIYTSIKRLRLTLKEVLNRELIHMRDGTYMIAPDLRFAVVSHVSDRHFSSRQNLILKFLETNGTLKRNNIQKLLKISPTLAKQELKSLVNRSLVEAIGQGKNTIYRKKETA